MTIKIIYGPPCSGKSTYVNDLLADNDIRFDYDLIIQSISNKNSHEYSDLHLPYVVQYRELLIKMSDKRADMDTTYIIATKITDKLQEELDGKDAEFILMDTPKEQCYEHLENDETRQDKKFWKDKINDWFDWHEEFSSSLKEVRTINDLKSKQNNKFWQMKMSADAKSADVFIYGEIVSYQWEETDTTASSFKKELDSLGDVSAINLYINSPGGNVFDGVAIYNMLKRHKAAVTVHVDALAASIASVIAMAGDKIVMPKNSMLMIHNPWTFAMGNAAELRKVADDLDRIGGSAFQTYMQKAGGKLPEDKLQEMLDAETWLSADEAYGFGLCDIVEEENQMAASVSEEMFAKYKNVPKQLTEQPSSEISAEEMAQRQRILDESKANQAYLNTILGGLI